MRIHHVAFAGLLGALATLYLASPAGAQESWEIRGGGGIGIPAGDLADAAGPGPAFGAGIGYRAADRLSVGVAGGVEVLTGGDYDAPGQIGREAPEVTLWRYGAELQYRLTEATGSRWSLTAGATVGGTTFDSDFRIVENPRTGELVTDISATYLSASGALSVDYAFTPLLEAFVDGRAHLAFADEEDTGVFEGVSAGRVSAFGTALSIPVTAGVRYRW